MAAILLHKSLRNILRLQISYFPSLRTVIFLHNSFKVSLVSLVSLVLVMPLLPHETVRSVLILGNQKFGVWITCSGIIVYKVS